MKKRLIKNGCLALCLTLLLSCSDWLTIQPKNDEMRDKVFESEQGFLEALSGLYILMREGNYGMLGEMTFVGIERLASLWEYSNKSIAEELAFHRYLRDDVDKYLGDIYKGQYKVLTNLNSMAEFIDNQNCLSGSSYNLIKGETLGLRAFLHFDLIRLWGPMPTKPNSEKLYLPYVTTFTYKKHDYQSYPEYMRLLKEDLNTAEICLEKSDPIRTMQIDSLNSDGEQDDLSSWGYFRQYKFNYFAVLMLQARVNLWMNNKEEALRYAKMVTEAKGPNGMAVFPLTTIESDALIDGSNVYDGGGSRSLYPEHIFGMQCMLPNFRIDQLWTSSDPLCYITKDKKASIYGSDTADIRGKFWKVRLNKDEAVPMKFNNYDLRSLPLMRVAEMYLIIMECAPLEDANSAYKYLYIARHRGVDGFIPMSEASRMEVVKSEYYKELCVEGQLFFMNKRLGIEFMKWSGVSCGESQYVLPIPQAEINY